MTNKKAPDAAHTGGPNQIGGDDQLKLTAIPSLVNPVTIHNNVLSID